MQNDSEGVPESTALVVGFNKREDKCNHAAIFLVQDRLFCCDGLNVKNCYIFVFSFQTGKLYFKVAFHSGAQEKMQRAGIEQFFVYLVNPVSIFHFFEFFWGIKRCERFCIRQYGRLLQGFRFLGCILLSRWYSKRVTAKHNCIQRRFLSKRPFQSRNENLGCFAD